VINSVRGGNEAYFLLSCLSGNGAKDVAEVLLTLKDKKWADKLDWHVAQ
jgi:tryptophan synthase